MITKEMLEMTPFDDAATKYLHEFAREFARLCGGYTVAKAWYTDMTIKSNMYFGFGIPAREAAKEFFNDTMKHLPQLRRLCVRRRQVS